MYLILTIGVLSFLFSLVLTPLVRDAFKRMGVVDHPDQIRKHHKQPIPRVGGIAIAVSYAAAFGIGLLLPFTYKASITKLLPDVWKLLPAAAIIFAIGLLDDLKGLRPLQKLIGQIAAAGVAYLAGVQVNSLGGHPLPVWLSFAITVVWLVGCTNALNLIDGLDGLAAGVGLFATITMLLAALLNQNLYLVLVTIPLVGCLFGFLRYNFNPASVFLGDSGSLLIGFMLGVFGALWSQKSATLLGMTAPMMAIAIPLLDTGLSVVRRFLRHQPIFGADRGHIHHRLLDRGLSHRQVALLMYGVCSLAALLSLLQSTVQNQFGGLIIVLFVMGAWVGIQHLGYVEFGVARQMIFKGTFRRMIDTQTRLQDFESALGAADTVDQLWNTLATGGRDFGFRSIRVHIQGRVLEKQFTEAGNEIFWQLRIPLPSGQYVNLQRDFNAEVNPLIIGGLVGVIERTMTIKLAKIESERELTPTVRVMAAAAGAGRLSHRPQVLERGTG